MFVSPDGTPCGSREFLEIDHIQPFARGGPSDRTGNLRLLCRAHNQWNGMLAFGPRAP